MTTRLQLSPMLMKSLLWNNACTSETSYTVTGDFNLDYSIYPLRQCPHTYASMSVNRTRQQRLHYPRISTHQSFGCSLMNFCIKSSHSLLRTLITSTPRERSKSSPPTNVLFSPRTTRGISYNRQAPVHIEHGDNVVYMVLSRYADAGKRPADSRVDISP